MFLLFRPQILIVYAEKIAAVPIAFVNLTSGSSLHIDQEARTEMQGFPTSMQFYQSESLAVFPDRATPHGRTPQFGFWCPAYLFSGYSFCPEPSAFPSLPQVVYTVML